MYSVEVFERGVLVGRYNVAAKDALAACDLAEETLKMLHCNRDKLFGFEARKVEVMQLPVKEETYAVA